MESINNLRNATKGLSAQMLGTTTNSPKVNAAQQGSAADLSAMVRLPTSIAPFAQVLDATDANVGKFYFMAGYSRVGGPDIVGGS